MGDTTHTPRLAVFKSKFGVDAGELEACVLLVGTQPLWGTAGQFLQKLPTTAGPQATFVEP